MKKENEYGDGCSVFQRKDGRWIAVCSDDGKPIKYFTSTNKEKGEQIVRKKLDNFVKTLAVKNNLEEFGINIPQKRPPILFETYITNWLENTMSNKLKPTSYDRLESIINTHVIPNIGHINLEEVTTEDIQTLVINKMFADKKSKSSIKKAYDAINACYKFGMTTKPKAVDDNPMVTIELPADHKFEKKEIRAFEENEKEAFKEACLFRYKNDALKYKLGYGMIFILNTGIREGEAIGLQWQDVIHFKDKEGKDRVAIELKRNVIETKHRSGELKGKKKVVVQDYLKTKKAHRQIPLNKTALECLEKLKEQNYDGDDKAFIFQNKFGERNTPSNIRRMFNEIATFAGLENCGVHTLRHTFATTLFIKKVDIKRVSELLGHSKVSVTWDTYVHILKKLEYDVVDIVDEI